MEIIDVGRDQGRKSFGVAYVWQIAAVHMALNERE